MDWKRALGLALTATALALVVWGLFQAKVSIQIDLPPAQAPRAAAPVNITLANDGTLRVEGAPSRLETLVQDVAAKASTPDKARQRIMIHPETKATYGAFSAVLDTLRNAGWSNIGWVDDSKETP